MNCQDNVILTVYRMKIIVVKYAVAIPASFPA
jgi:hypothetical protein